MGRKQRYTRKELIDFLLDYYKVYGITPTQKDFRYTDGYPSDTPYIREFSTWNNGIKAAGLPLRQKGRPTLANAHSISTYMEVSDDDKQRIFDTYKSRACKKEEFLDILGIKDWEFSLIRYEGRISVRDRHSILRNLKRVPLKRGAMDRYRYVVQLFLGTKDRPENERVFVKDYDKMKRKFDAYLLKHGIEVRAEKPEGYNQNMWLLIRTN